MNDNYLVVKSNYFIMNSGYDLSLEEQKIILTLASMVSPDDEDFKPYKLKISDFIKLLGVKDQGKYVEVPKITKELMKKVFEIKDGDSLIQTAWLSSVKYEKGSGMVELTFSHYLKPYMLKLNELYTQYRLNNILNMKSKYSIRLYEILKANEFKIQKSVTIDVEELRKLFKAEDIYKKYNDFKKHIIIRSQDEMKKYSDISFEFEEIKAGKKVDRIKFLIRKNLPARSESIKIIAPNEGSILDADMKPGDESILFIQSMIDENLTRMELEKIYEAGDGNIRKITDVYNYYKDMSKTKNINNMVGYMLTLLKNGFSEPRRSTAYKEFDEREYDYDKLEKQLLGWE